MQRAPVFIFADARDARDFQVWLRANFDAIKAQAESTTSVGKLLEIENYHAHNFIATRFDYLFGLTSLTANLIYKHTRQHNFICLIGLQFYQILKY